MSQFDPVKSAGLIKQGIIAYCNALGLNENQAHQKLAEALHPLTKDVVRKMLSML